MPISHSPSRRSRGVAVAPLPAEPLGAGAIGLDDVARRERRARGRILLGLVPDAAQLDRVHARCAAASSSIAHSSAKVPTASPGARMNVFATMSMLTLSCDIELEGSPRRRRCRAGRSERLGQRVVRASSPTMPVWISASKRPSALRAERHALLGHGAPADRSGTRLRATARCAPAAARASCRRRASTWWLPQRPCRRTRRRRRAR